MDQFEEIVALEMPTLEALATEAGLLPEQLPGDRRHPVKLNRTTWQLRAAMGLNGWTLDTQLSQEDFDAALASVAGALAR